MRKKEFAFSILLMLIVFAVIYMVVNRSAGRNEYSYSMFERDLEAGNVTKVVIRPNSETPTGTVEVVLEGGARQELVVSDVTEMEKGLRASFPGYVVDEVQQSGILRTIVINVIIIGVMIYIFSMMMSGQVGGGAKMTNFSKSHGKL